MRGNVLAAGASYPAITITVNVASNAPASSLAMRRRGLQSPLWSLGVTSIWARRHRVSHQRIGNELHSGSPECSEVRLRTDCDAQGGFGHAEDQVALVLNRERRKYCAGDESTGGYLVGSCADIGYAELKGLIRPDRKSEAGKNQDTVLQEAVSRSAARESAVVGARKTER